MNWRLFFVLFLGGAAGAVGILYRGITEKILMRHLPLQLLV